MPLVLRLQSTHVIRLHLLYLIGMTARFLWTPYSPTACCYENIIVAHEFGLSIKSLSIQGPAASRRQSIWLHDWPVQDTVQKSEKGRKAVWKAESPTFNLESVSIRLIIMKTLLARTSSQFTIPRLFSRSHSPRVAPSSLSTQRCFHKYVCHSRVLVVGPLHWTVFHSQQQRH